MKRTVATLLLCLPSLAQQTATTTERWQMTGEFYGTTRYYRFDLDRHDPAHLTGKFGGTSLTGTLTANHIVLSGKADNSATTVDATLNGDNLSGRITTGDVSSPPLIIPFTAVLVKPLAKTEPQTHEFQPTVYYREFSPFHKPVLTVNPGDTIHTTTVDAGGSDAQDIKRIAGGNPQTGPFYIQGAQPGDTLVVHVRKLALNRKTAGSDDQLVQSALSPDLAIKTRDNNKGVTWHLDLEHMTAVPEPTTGDHLKHLNIPLRPMLGCIATATGPGGSPPATGDSGSFGGNLDFNEIGEGATVYLPVMNPGALLYLGDAHALQGDGELNGNALETSMDVTVTVDLLPNKRLSFPRVETASQIIALGYSGYLDDAFKDATSNMANWLMDDYKLTPSEVAQFLGVSAQYRVTEVADRNSGIALKIDKSLLKNLE